VAEGRVELDAFLASSPTTWNEIAFYANGKKYSFP
jgi:hypothetical protein